MSSANECPQSPDFAALGLNSQLLSSLAAMGFETPTAIQTQAVPALLNGDDVLGQAATGTGKTAAFGLPLLQRLMESKRSGGPGALILVPTRELAMQVATALTGYGRGTGIRVVPIYGGQPMGLQLRAIKSGADVIVATPGRLLDHVNRKSLKMGGIQMVVLDEADEMLDMGFADDLDAIFSMLPDDRQTALFSATLPQRIASIAARHLREPVRISVRAEKPKGGVERVTQRAYIVLHRHKAAALARILATEEPVSTMVFCRTREDVDELAAFINREREQCLALHGGMSQMLRDRVMQRFRKSEVSVLVATDVAARGLDIDHISHVVNFDMPPNAEVYVHRIGRTGRAGRSGVAISLIKPNEQRALMQVEARTGIKVVVDKLPSGAHMRRRRIEQSLKTVTDLLENVDVAQMARFAVPLAAEFAPEQLAAVALMLAQGEVAAHEDEDIPCMTASQQSAQPRRPNNRFKRRHGGQQNETARPAARRAFGGRPDNSAPEKRKPASRHQTGAAKKKR